LGVHYTYFILKNDCTYLSFLDTPPCGAATAATNGTDTAANGDDDDHMGGPQYECSNDPLGLV